MTLPLLPDDAVDDDLQRRIGRNLLVFARIEANFKKLMTVNRISFALAAGMSGEEAARSFQRSVQARSTSWSKRTLGELIGGYLAEVMEPVPERTIDPAEGQCLISLGYQRTPDAKGMHPVAERLAAILSERNALVHHLMDRLGTGTVEQIHETRDWLDVQYSRALDFLLELRNELHHLGQARMALLDDMRRADWAAMFEQAWHAGSPLATHFSAYAGAEQRNDGWTDYGRAAASAHAAIPDELANLKARHGFAKIRPALEAADLFDFKLEPTTGGGQRLLYRLRPGAADQAPLPVP